MPYKNDEFETEISDELTFDPVPHSKKHNRTTAKFPFKHKMPSSAKSNENMQISDIERDNLK